MAKFQKALNRNNSSSNQESGEANQGSQQNTASKVNQRGLDKNDSNAAMPSVTLTTEPT